MRLISFLICTLLGGVIFGQKTELLEDFSLYELNGTVYISCTITQGKTCNGIVVWRSDDTISFTKVGEVDGICGSSSAPIPYNFTDQTPIFNRPSYYKVELGGSGFSEVLSIELIDTRLYGFQVRPNPAKDFVTIYFENNLFEEFELTVYNLMGKQIHQMISNTNEFRFNTNHLKAGSYIFVIESISTTTNPLQGKLMIQH